MLIDSNYIKKTIAIILFSFVSVPALAYSLYDENGSKLNLDLTIGISEYHSEHAYNQVHTKPSRPTWSEDYIRYGISGSHAFTNAGSLYLTVQGLSTWNLGTGDAAGFSVGNERQTTLGNAYIGWRSGDLLPKLGHNAVDILFGRKFVKIGNGFLINGDALDFGNGFNNLIKAGIAPPNINRGGDYWFAARRAFGRTAILKVNTDAGLAFEGFWLSSVNTAQAHTRSAGGHVSYTNPKAGKIALTYLRGLHVDRREADFFGLRQREGQNTVYAHGQTSLGVPSLKLGGGYVYQNNRKYNHENAWYAKANWTFSNLAWQPMIGYRYGHFSSHYDPLYFGFNGYGTWFQGEVASNYAGPFSTDADVQQIKLTAQPLNNLTLGALFFDFTRTHDAHLNAQEYDFYAMWFVNKHLLISPLIGLYDPKYSANEGGSQLGGSGDNFYEQLFAIISF
jgi:hypothetical protein